jgi:branched-chain amino acid transport system substrate-binding protein
VAPRLSSLFALFGVALLTACGEVAPPRETVKLGLNLELTGDVQAVGASSRKAAELFAEQVNARGGVALAGGALPLELAIHDNGANANQSAGMAQHLVSRDNVVAMVGPNSSDGASAAARIAEGLKCVMISPWSTSAGTTMDEASGIPKRYVFRACFTDLAQARSLAKFARETLGAETAAVMHDADNKEAAGQAGLFAETFTAAGGRMVAAETYASSRPDFSAPLARIQQAAPAVLFLPAYYSEIPPIAAEARRLGLTATLLGNDGWASPDLLRVGGASVEGAYFGNHFSARSETAETRKFVADYTARFGSPPDDVAGLTYDACGLLVAALEKSGKNEREAVREALAQLAGYRGVTGTFRFSPGAGDPAKTMAILQIRDGRLVWVKDATP